MFHTVLLKMAAKAQKGHQRQFFTKYVGGAQVQYASNILEVAICRVLLFSVEKPFEGN